MKTLSKYLIKESAGPFLIALMVVGFMFVTGEMFDRIQEMVFAGVSFGGTLLIMMALIPMTVVYTLPIASLMGALVSVGRLAHDNEVVALYAGGVPTSRIARPLLCAGAALTLITLIVADRVAPGAARMSRNIIVQSARENPLGHLRIGETNNIGRFTLYFTEKDADGRLANVRLIDRAEDKSTYYYATSGRFEFGNGGRTVRLALSNNGFYVTRETGGAPGNLKPTFFEEYVYTVSGYEYNETLPESEHLMTLSALWKAIGKDGTADEDRREMQFEFAGRIAMPFACLVFVLAAIPIAACFHGTVKTLSLGACFALVLVYYILLLVGKGLFEGGTIKLTVGHFLPNIVIGALGIFLLWKADRDRRSTA
ncbi:LptF/LptG family permease [Candidatus Hydrogenedentota bacterium]